MWMNGTGDVNRMEIEWCLEKYPSSRVMFGEIFINYLDIFLIFPKYMFVMSCSITFLIVYTWNKVRECTFRYYSLLQLTIFQLLSTTY